MEKEYRGEIKFWGKDSMNMTAFRMAIVTLILKNDHLLLKTNLLCNPGKTYRTININKVDACVKCQRLIVKPRQKEYVELHFRGIDSQDTQKLCDDIHRMSKGLSGKSPQNKAEVGRAQKIDTAHNPRLFHVSPSSKQLSLSQFGDQLHKPVSAGNPGSSPCFTRVKESKPQSHAMEIVSDYESKENHQRDPIKFDLDKENQSGDRKPLQFSSIQFYSPGTRNTSALATSGSKQAFKVTKPRPVTAQFVPPERKKGQFTEFMKSYSWNQSRTVTSPTAVKKPALQLQGFANLGNTCYMNAILQSLCGLDTFSMDLQSLCKYHGKILAKSSLAMALTKLMMTKQRPQINGARKVEELLSRVKKTISDTAKRFNGSQQHDAHEFLCQVLDQLKEEVIKLTKSREEKDSLRDESSRDAVSLTDNSDLTNDHVTASRDNLLIVQTNPGRCRTPPSSDCVTPPSSLMPSAEKASSNDRCSPTGYSVNCSTSALHINPTYANFEFDVKHCFECVNCGEQTQKTEQFNDLSLDMPSCKNKLPGMVLSLQDALDIFFQKEEIEYKCEKCGHAKAEVTHKFVKIPRILILHLKRYSYNMHSTKMQEDLQLPRFITLQDHCESSTIPHLSCLSIQQMSPVKSPLLHSPTKQPTAVTPDYRQRRRRHSLDENSLPMIHKKVRRSLLTDVQDQSSPSDKVLTVEMEDDDEQLQKVLALSRQEYEASQRNTQQVSDDMEGTSGEKEDMSWMSEDEQIRLAISRSLESSLPVPEDQKISHDTSTPFSNHRSTSPLVFKKPVSSAHKEHREDLRTVDEKNKDSASLRLENNHIDLTDCDVRSFTTACDFMYEAEARQSSPNNSLSGADSEQSDKSFTNCRQLSHKNKSDLSQNNASSSVAANVGCLGALSNSSTGTTHSKAKNITNVDSYESQGVAPSVAKVPGKKASASSNIQGCASEKQRCDYSSMYTESWTLEEEEAIAKDFEDDLTDPFEDFQTSQAQESCWKDSLSSDKKGQKFRTEEKENVFPAADEECVQAPLDKEAEAKLLQHKLRQTEIEKGVLPHSYRLVSIVSHKGQESSYGHYISDVFDIKKQTWFSFDDTNVKKTTESHVRTQSTSTGYIFFYLSKEIFDEIDSKRPMGTGKELSQKS